MLKGIERLSHWLARKIIKEYDKEYYDYYQYSLHGILSAIFYWTVSGILALIFGYINYIFIGIILLLEIRKFSGGIHGSTSLQCFILSILFFNIVGSSSILLYPYYLILFIISLCNIFGLSKLPKYTKTAVKHKIEQRKKIKKNYILMLSSYILINSIMVTLTYFNIIDLSKISVMVSMALIVNKFTLSDFAFKLLDKLN